MSKIKLFFVICCLSNMFCGNTVSDTNVNLVRSEEASVDVYIKGSLFTSYHYSLGFAKPIFYPIVSAGGNWINRGYPMRNDIAGESRDHWHQKSLWFTYGDVNGVDYWAETPESGKIRHTGFTIIQSGDEQGILGYTADWIDPDGEAVLKQETNVIFGHSERSRSIDFHITLTAHSRQVTFGDTKEGMFGIRYHKNLHEKNGGTYINSNGQEKEQGPNGVWGKRANWVALRGSIGDEPMVIAIFDHPESVNNPTWWHARGYGLFAANPFGRKDFEKGSVPMNVTIDTGESLTFRYHVLFYSGTLTKEDLDSIYDGYAGRE